MNVDKVFGFITALVAILVVVVCIGNLTTVSGDDGGYPPPVTITDDSYPAPPTMEWSYPAPATVTPKPRATYDLRRPTPTGSVTATLEAYPVAFGPTDNMYPAPKPKPKFDKQNLQNMIEDIVTFIKRTFGRMILWMR